MKGLYIGRVLWKEIAIDFLHSAIVKCGTNDQYGEEMDEKVSKLRRKIVKNSELEKMNSNQFKQWLVNFHSIVLETKLYPDKEGDLVQDISRCYNSLPADEQKLGFLEAIDLPRQREQFHQNVAKVKEMSQDIKLDKDLIRWLFTEGKEKAPSRDEMLFQLSLDIFSIELQQKPNIESKTNEFLQMAKETFTDFKKRIESREPKFTAERGVKLQSIAE